MSTNFVEVVTVDHVRQHPNADRLDIAIIRGTTVVVAKDSVAKGDQVVYFPPDMMIPQDVGIALGVSNYLRSAIYPGDTASTKCRIGAARLRGQPSYGFVIPMAQATAVAGTLLNGNVNEAFGAVKYQPPVRFHPGRMLPNHPAFHEYTDIEHYWRFPDAIPEGTPVRITEKLHGTNFRVGLIQDEGEFVFMAGSHRRRRDKDSLYWKPLEDYEILSLLTHLCDEKHDVILFGEIFGPGIQDLDYGLSTPSYRIFDAMVGGHYLDWDVLSERCAYYNVPTVPVLYEGPFYKPLVDEYTHGPSTFKGIRSKFKGREGIVITPIVEQFSESLGGRAIVKSVSADYLAR